jgi:hypothetical protein
LYEAQITLHFIGSSSSCKNVTHNKIQNLLSPASSILHGEKDCSNRAHDDMWCPRILSTLYKLYPGIVHMKILVHICTDFGHTAHNCPIVTHFDAVPYRIKTRSSVNTSQCPPMSKIHENFDEFESRCTFSSTLFRS